MDLRRLRVGEWIVGASGLLLLIALFLPWYGDPSSTAWEAFTVLDVILALLALAALSVPIVTATQRVPAVPLAVESLTALFGLLGGGPRADPGPQPARRRRTAARSASGSACVATLGIIAGGLFAMRDERRSPEGRYTDVSRRSPERPARDRDAARAAARGRLLTFERLRISDWVVFVAALALLFTTAAPVWYSTKAGDEARRVQQEAQPEEGQPSGQAEAEVEREAGALADNAEKNAWEADGTIDRIILICVLLTSALGVLAGFWRASGRPRARHRPLRPVRA